MKSNEVYQILIDKKGKGSDFSYFNKLTDYQKKRLYNVNYWKAFYKEDIYDVPEDYEDYWETLNENLSKCHDY